MEASSAHDVSLAVTIQSVKEITPVHGITVDVIFGERELIRHDIADEGIAGYTGAELHPRFMTEIVVCGNVLSKK